jgi:hypothetical protein
LASEFIDFVSRKDLIEKYGYKAGESAHGNKYALFKTLLKYDSSADTAGRIIVRTKDFARTPSLRKKLKAFLESSTRTDVRLANLLPEVLVETPPERLFVCEDGVQGELFSWEHFNPVIMPVAGRPTAVELFAGAGGLSLGRR